MRVRSICKDLRKLQKVEQMKSSRHARILQRDRAWKKNDEDAVLIVMVKDFQ